MCRTCHAGRHVHLHASSLASSVPEQVTTYLQHNVFPIQPNLHRALPGPGISLQRSKTLACRPRLHPLHNLLSIVLLHRPCRHLLCSSFVSGRALHEQLKHTCPVITHDIRCLASGSVQRFLPCSTFRAVNAAHSDVRLPHDTRPALPPPMAAQHSPHTPHIPSISK